MLRADNVQALLLPADIKDQERIVRFCILAVALVMGVPAQAGSGFFQRGKITRMHTAKCTFIPAGGFHLTVALFGTADPRTGIGQPMCPEYLLEGDRVNYRIRPLKTDVLLTLGTGVQFKLHKGRMVLRPEDSKREYKFEIYEMRQRAEVIRLEVPRLAKPRLELQVLQDVQPEKR